VVRTVEQRTFHIDHREARQHAVRQCFAQALLDRRYVFARDRAALDRIDKLETFARLVRLHLDPHVTVLAASAGLLDELAFDLDRLPDRFAVRHLGRAHVGFHAKFALHAINQNFQV
jgi:hypothetical protein